MNLASVSSLVTEAFHRELSDMTLDSGRVDSLGRSEIMSGIELMNVLGQEHTACILIFFI